MSQPITLAFPSPRGPEATGGAPLVTDAPSEPLMAQQEGSPAFRELVSQQAALLAQGKIDANSLPEFLSVANAIACIELEDDSRVYTDPNGRPLEGANAELLYNARSPAYWVLAHGESQGVDAKLTYDELSVVADVLSHYFGVPASDIPEDLGRELDIACERAAHTLGISDPNIPLSELIQAIHRRQELGDRVAAGEFNSWFLPRLLREFRAGGGTTITLDAIPADPAERDPQQELFDKFIEGGEAINEDGPREKRRKGAHRRRERGRWLGRAILPAVATLGVGIGLRALDVVPLGSVGIGAATGAVGMMIATRLNREVWSQQKTVWQKVRALGKAALVGMGLGAAVATGAMFVADAAMAGIDAIRSALSDGSSATLHQVPILPDPVLTPETPTQPTPPSVFDQPMQTEPLEHFTGVDGPDNNPWLENTGCDAVGDLLDVKVREITGQAIDWSTIDPQAYHDFMSRVLEQNGLSWSSIMYPGDTLTIDPQLARDFLASQLPGVDLGLAGAKS